ncbi:NAD+ synthetase [Bartonella quintana JK 12]|uniref:Glutamine-dependent NAD(+) synthetase n=3 Tax=Bartonella quintana TaxID=803 RepID=W3TX66_BARQI|nr:NAD+ synthetase [Bartonella quintana BQ2-D70]ETS14254.1 NAD+ synthetase [Bartonella quintana JK 73rel]ETS15941.1 NAD+ synthetase [Bartonella quintana JK 73]ETS17943.1 NAD+ synthetase [Bartonella quintana JK 7]ETS18772.1 NAD+ synthetase [Bartonella quintana JK 12]KEC59831.1 NAD+ synthetase [Bartonella quintana JK 19]KEC62847.1 NAD+ synthetase [Bartonella quintana JK 63]KEC63295.1 NAD+ synthetase [Bartonella quintana JK 31]KEC64144.1 NAD+ synthetase [Bartonella quintana JK 56]KEC66627.1 N
MIQKVMKNDFRVAVAQLNPVVGDIEGNFSLAVMAYQKAREEGADLVLFTELFISAYPPEDLVLKPAFIKTCEGAVKELAKLTTGGPGIVIGLPLRYNDKIFNGVMLLDEGRIISESLKFDLPNYAEFDERRLFSSGPRPEPIVYHGIRLGIVICEDIWNDFSFCAELRNKGAEIILVLNGSPYHRNKTLKRIEVVRAQALQSGLPIIYANQVGGQDELVFDGGSFALNGQGKMVFQMKHFESHIALSHWQKKMTGWQCISGPNENLFNGLAADYQACVLGLGDYVNKNGFKDVILGLSGGIDSALCTAMAVDALGAKRVRTVMMPYHYTSQESLKDAKECAHLLGCDYQIIPIIKPVEVFLSTLAPVFLGLTPDVTEENLQSRVRGTLLMALSNKFGSMVVTTGNKSEMAVGYATLYGDMNGGFNPLKDIYKTQVYALAEWRNKNHLQNWEGSEGVVIPPNIIAKAPSAELCENQKDEDSLPPYPILDDILQSLIENDMSVCDIVKRGYLRETVEKIEHLLYVAEYKRRQSAPGVKISYKNFGRDRRYPIVNHFRDKN